MIYRFNLFILLAGVVFFSACVRHDEHANSIHHVSSDSLRLEVKYAEGFDIAYENGYIKITTFSLPQNSFFRDSVFILTNSETKLPEQTKIISPGANRIGCQSSTHLAYINALQQLNQVAGLCGVDYVNNMNVAAILKKNKVEELCLADQIQLEALYKSKTNLFLTYPFGAEADQNFTEKGVQTLLIAEYLEESQLARLEWIKLFGLLTGRASEAEAYFNQVELAYRTLKMQAAQKDETFIMNLPFQDKWFMPAASSVGVELIEDAGIRYFYPTTKGTENEVHSKEEVWNDGVEADYWVIIASRPADFDLADLIAEEPVYNVFESVKKKQVIFCNTAEVDYFAQGVIEPHVLLKDLLYATGQLTNYEPTYFFLLE